MKIVALLVLIGFALLLDGCSFKPQFIDSGDSRCEGRCLDHWQLIGRIALQGNNDSWTANIDWRHQPSEDLMKLSGPLGQGGLIIHLFEGCISITRDLHNSEYSCEVDNLIQKQLGIFVPVHFLSYWVLGLPAPDHSYELISGGFIQSNWQVLYKPKIGIADYSRPRKIIVSKQETKLKLVIDKWIQNDLSEN